MNDNFTFVFGSFSSFAAKKNTGCCSIYIVLIIKRSSFEWRHKQKYTPDLVEKVHIENPIWQTTLILYFCIHLCMSNDWTMTKVNRNNKSRTNIACIRVESTCSFSFSFVYLFCWRVDKITFLTLSSCTTTFGKLEHTDSAQHKRYHKTKRHYDYTVTIPVSLRQLHGSVRFRQGDFVLHLVEDFNAKPLHSAEDKASN